MAWIYLFFGILAEVCGTTSMKLSRGFSKLTPSIALFVFYGLSLILVNLALKRLEVSVAYAVWSAVGTAIMATIGVLYFKEPFSALKVASLVLIVLGVVGLNLSSR
ncbi:multidrug efflux SMR transporter [Alicyclobacillus fastidiosus]|uniref:Multidrug efflux SMR transporter n=1 Tax=Alicyclobacillus fastidiosus TaxID=392011 RepID=A0ABY6ZJI0_9BACL|nr:multidrug efflux SMR transporter [Alicyclobacillus fastidiosus]WAH42065.1 multidrug efflux SMR transporter [Alicyclobacillus fastidiosus]GMA63828.1 QacE family quaternary ammonium compound efflux SMR transporter [Alicyclobacillus fastidiosus]